MSERATGDQADHSAVHDDWAIKRLVYDRIQELGFTSLRAFERDRGLPQNALHYYLRKEKLGEYPDLDVINRFADALDLTTEAVSGAFAQDFAKTNNLVLVTAPRSPAQREMEQVLAKMPEDWRWVAVDLARVLLDRSRQAGGLPPTREV